MIGPATVGLQAAAGPTIFQFPPLQFGPRTPLGTIPHFLDRLANFLDRLPKGPLIAAELRNAEIIENHAPQYAEALRNTSTLHGFVAHPTMPTVARQAALLANAGTDPASQPLCLRWLLKTDQTYTGAKSRYEPFNAIIDDDTPTRSQVADLIIRATGSGRSSFIVVNNKAEGSAPLTVERLASTLSPPDADA